MKISGLLRNLAIQMPVNSAIYSANDIPKWTIILIIALVLMICIGVILVIKRKIKINSIKNKAQGLYGSPEILRKKAQLDIPEDLYGCPRPDDMNDEPTEE